MIDESFYNEIQNVLTKFFSSLDLSPVMPEIANILDYGIQEQFRTEGRYFGGRLGSRSFGVPWFQLAESTIKQREKKGYWPGSILQQTASLVGSASANVRGSEVEAGVNMTYGWHLHYGTSVIPPRPIIPHSGLPEEMLEMISETVGKYILRVTK